jgi:hypothetical protein
VVGGFSFLSIIAIIAILGPFLWLPIYYIIVLIWVLRPAFKGRFGRVAAAVICLAGWAGYAESQAIRAQAEAARIAEANARAPSRPEVDAIVFHHTTICDAICTELLAKRLVKAVYLGPSAARVLTLSQEGPCEGASALASKLLRANNRFDLCIKDELAHGITGRELLFEESRRFERDFWGDHSDVTTFTVSEWHTNKWRSIYDRRFGRIYVLQYFPVFLAGFTDTGWLGVTWWRRAIKVGEPVDMKEVIGQVLGIKLTGEFDPMVIQRLDGGGAAAGDKIPAPAPPAALAAEIDRLSASHDAAVLKQTAGFINRFIKENGTYEPVRVALESLLASRAEQVKASAYQAIAYPPVAIDDQLLKFIMDNSPDWQSLALGALLGRLSEDQLKPYEAQIVAAYFAADADRSSRRVPPNNARETLALAVPAMRLEALKSIFDRCPDISEAALRTMAERIDFDNRRMSDATLLKLKTTWAPCALGRMATFHPHSIWGTARALAWLGDGSAAAAEIDKRLAAPVPTDTDTDKSNLQGVPSWIRNNQAAFDKRWAKASAP